MMSDNIILIGIIIFQAIVYNISLLKYFSLLKDYKAYFAHQIEYTDTMMEYCLTDIMRKCVEEQRYEEAAKCKELINKLKELNQK